MCGVPHHSAERYIKTLIDKGYKVAICEQVEDPKEAKGVVKREVVQVITPGMVMDSSMLRDAKSNYIASISECEDGSFVIVYHELSTGEFQLLLIDDSFENVVHELGKQDVKEIVIASTFSKTYTEQLKNHLRVLFSYEDNINFIAEFRHL